MLASSHLRACRALSRSAKRGLHDLSTIPGRPPVVGYGPPGRSAVSGHVVTVFGATGFLGRYLVSKLAKLGTQVIVPYRDEDTARLFKPMGDLGQIVLMEWDSRNLQQIEECLRHSDIVYNLVGRDYPTKNFNFDDVHVTGAENIAKVAAANGTARLVHVSHLNASSTSTSDFYKSKAEGEQVVREAYPNATIVRPGSMFGSEDRLFNNAHFWPIWWKINLDRKFRPVHVFDVAQALANLMPMPSSPRLLNLPGPATITHEYLLELISAVTYSSPSRAPVLPKAVAKALAQAAQAVWWPALSPDEVERRFIDDVDVKGDWEAVGIVPDHIEALAINYLRRYRSAENFTRPVVLPAVKPPTVSPQY